MGFDERVWIMVDIETSGPVYGRHSMLELGAVVGSRAGGIIDRFSALIRPISEHVTASHRTYRDACERGEDPAAVMERFATWSRPHVDARATFIARPAAFDWPWIVYYAWSYLGQNPFGFKAVCASSWLDARRKRFQVELPHVAVEDAEIQLAYFLAHG